MPRVHAEQAAVIDAPAADIYAILSDYQHEHPQILPQEYFPMIKVEQGGQGAGTVFQVKTRALGVERGYQMIVSEPEPGRRLVETDTRSDLETTFTVTPVDQGRRSEVKIATEWQSAAGISGLIEKLLTPAVMRRIYRKELRKLAAYVQSKRAGQIPAAQ